MPGGEVQPAQQLRPALELRAERLRELPHPHRVGRRQIRGDLRQVRTDPQPLAPLRARAVDQDEGEPVGPLGGGQRGGERTQQLRLAGAGTALDEQVRTVGRQVHRQRAARTRAEHPQHPAARRGPRPRRVGGGRPTGGERGGGCAGQPQLV